MALSRRTLLGAVGGWVWTAGRAAAQAGAFPAVQPDNTLFPTPRDGAAVGINPPGFGWWRAPGASMYRLNIWNEVGHQVYTAPYLKDPVHLPDRVFPAGEYVWNVEASDASEKVLARRAFWRFVIPEGVPEFPWEAPAVILARLPDTHPRYIFPRDSLPELRWSLAAGRKRAGDSIRSSAERYLRTALPEPPVYHTYTDPARQRMGYTKYYGYLRGIIDSAMSTMALAYLLTGDERFGLAAKKILLEVETWGIEGPMSVMAPWGDEPGLSMAKHGQRAYDWLYDLFDESERRRVREMTIGRARQVLARLKKADYLAKPSESHNGRLIAYMSEYAVVLNGEAPDTAEWLDYSLRGLTTFYPHWGDSDGGWAEGVSYGLSYNSIYLSALESLLAAAGYNLYQRPFFRGVRRFFLYCTSPVGEMKPYGDGTEGGVGGSGATLMTHYGRRFDDPACLWYAQQAGNGISDPLIAVLTEDTIKPAAPAALASAAVFRGIGWAALHSALDAPQRDTFLLFKSSPYGSVSHSHADQNSFAILKGGRALAIPSGYYGPSYGMPHHDQWTRQTKANNSILVNGAGQVDRSGKAVGRITDFRHQQALTYVSGDATAAYGGRLVKFLRHALFLRPAVFVVLDEIEAPTPAEFIWLMHALEEMQMNESERWLVSRRKGASLSVKLACPAGLGFSQTDQFDTAYNQGNPPEYWEDKANQWHFSARTLEPSERVRIGAAMVVRGPDETFSAEWIESPGRLGVSFEAAEGAGQAWLDLTPGAAALVEGRWEPRAGREESLVIAEQRP